MQIETWPIIGAAAVVATPLIYNTVKDIILDIRRNKRERTYISIQLIFILDKFVADCAVISWYDGYPQISSMDEEAEIKHDKPELILSSVKGDYKHISTDLLYKLQSIDMCIMQIKELLHDEGSFYNPPAYSEYYNIRRNKYRELGVYVKKIINDIFLEMKTVHPPWENGYDPSESLERSRIAMCEQAARVASKIIERKARKSERKARQL